MDHPEIAVIPQNHCLKIAIYTLTGMGIFPLKFQNESIIKKVYHLYSRTMLLYYFTIGVRHFVEMIHLISLGNLRHIMQNVGMTMLIGISLIRVMVCRSNYISTIIKHIKEREEKILACEDQEIKDIYMSCANYSQMVNKYFIIIGFATAIPFNIQPFAEMKAYPELYPRDNITGRIIDKPLPLHQWAPYNYNDHYVLSFIWQLWDGFWITSLVVCPDGLLFSLMIFPVGQLKILQSVLRNLERFGEREAKISGLDRNESGVAVVRACIKLHQDIISYIENCDRALKYLMLLDFASCSLQMAVILFQIIMQGGLKIPSLFIAEFLMSMITQMFLFYWHANEISVESVRVAEAAVDNAWYEESQTVKAMLIILIRRAQKSLTLSIGPFYSMSTDTAIAILKATYSYGMLLRKSYERKSA